MTVSLRRAVAADVPAMAAVFVAAWRAAYGDVVAPELLDRLDVGEVAGWLGPLVEETTLTTTVAVAAGSVAGFARYGPDPDRAMPDAGYLAALYVDPHASGHGIGRRLLARAVASLAQSGRPDVRLWVFEANARARRLYERAGFRLDGRRTVDPQWNTPQVSYRRQPVNTAVPLPPLPDMSLDPVVDLLVEPVRRPLRAPFRTALREIRSLSGWRVTLTTAGGATSSATTVATPQITGDTDDSITAALAGPLRAAVASGGGLADVLGAVAAAGAGTPSAAAAVDVATHGLAASQLGVSVATLLGGRGSSVVTTDVTISVDSPAAMAEAAAARVAEGHGTLKLKLADAAGDVERVLAVRDRIAAAPSAGSTPVRMRLDANQAWTPEDAVTVLDRLFTAGVELELVEQPVAAAHVDGLAFVSARSPYPVMADESVFTADDARRVGDARAADLVNLKLLKCGGLFPARELVSVCAEAGLGLLVGCMLEPAEGVAVAKALASVASAGPLAHDLDAGWWVAPS